MAAPVGPGRRPPRTVPARGRAVRYAVGVPAGGVPSGGIGSGSIRVPVAVKLNSTTTVPLGSSTRMNTAAVSALPVASTSIAIQPFTVPPRLLCSAVSCARPVASAVRSPVARHAQIPAPMSPATLTIDAVGVEGVEPDVGRVVRVVGEPPGADDRVGGHVGRRVLGGGGARGRKGEAEAAGTEAGERRATGNGPVGLPRYHRGCSSCGAAVWAAGRGPDTRGMATRMDAGTAGHHPLCLPFTYLFAVDAAGWAMILANSMASGEAMDAPPRDSAGEQDDAFGARLRRAREAAGLAQEELAAQAGLSPNTVGGLERGEHRHPHPATVHALAAALGLSDAERAALAAAATRQGRPVAPVAAPPGLPAPLSPLIGREHEVVEVSAVLRGEGVRLVTLTGPGGVGKTSLALRVAAELSPDFGRGAAFVPLAPVRDPAIVARTVAHALGVAEAGGRSPIDRLGAALRDRHLLLVLDNFEHLLDAAPLVSDLLARCPRLTVLATSRATLRLAGEHVYPVPPLAVPDPDRLPAMDALADVAAVRLFVDRARAADPAFVRHGRQRRGGGGPLPPAGRPAAGDRAGCRPERPPPAGGPPPPPGEAVAALDRGAA